MQLIADYGVAMDNPTRHIRTHVFCLTQAEFAEILRVNKSTVHRWERKRAPPPYWHWPGLRALAKEREIEWDDRWLIPADHGAK